MKLIVGLGNPGKEYEKTRHNIGFRVLNKIIKNKNKKWKKNKKADALIYEEGNYVYAKPLTYMNLSGQAINKLTTQYNIHHPEDVLIIYDDKDLEFNKIRYKQKGSAGGHKGALSTIEYLDTEEVPRLKIGIAPVNQKIQDTSEFVLSKFTSEEEQKLPEIIDKAIKKMDEVL